MFYNEGKWPLGLVTCKVAKVFSFGCFTTSGITIALIAMNRFAQLQLIFTLKNFTRIRCVRITCSVQMYSKIYSGMPIAAQIALNWFFPFILMTFMSFGVGGEISLSDDICRMGGRASWYLLLAVYPLVLITIVVCYTKIYFFAER
jgi:hypothetical protein